MAFFDDLDEDTMEGYGATALVKSDKMAAAEKILAEIRGESSPEEAEEEDMETDYDEDEYEQMDEVEQRLSMANYYKLFLEGRIFTSEDPVAKAVEREFRGFAKDRLEILLGMKSPEPKFAAPAEAKFPFTQEEVAALKALAMQVMAAAKPGLIPKAEPKPAEAPAIRQISAPKTEPVAEAPRKTMTPVMVPKKRGPGRPKGAKDKVQRKPREDSPAAVETPKKTASKEKEPEAGKEKKKGQVMSSHVKPIPMPSTQQVNALETTRASSSFVTNLG